MQKRTTAMSVFWKKSLALPLFCFGILLFFAACRRIPESSIPRLPVYCEVYFNSAQGRMLAAPGAGITLTKPTLAGQALGYGGLLVVHSLSEADRYYAYDLACPYEAKRSCCLHIDGIEAVCACCKSRFSIVYGAGVPLSGPAQTPLLSYSVSPIPGGIRIY